MYLLAALPFTLVAVMGWKYGAALHYAPAAILCLVQFWKPTRARWLVLLWLYAVAVAFYAGLLGVELSRLLRQEPRSILVDVDDSVAFIGVVAFLLLVLAALWSVRRYFARPI